MTTNSNSLIKREVDRLFAEVNAKPFGCCRNPITAGGFVKGLDPIAPQKKDAAAALLAREWFAVNGPRDAPPLPLSHADVEDYRNARGLAGIVGFFARSLSRQEYDVCKHPPFDEFARGLMALAAERGLWGLENDETLIRRFPPRPLVGMMPSAYWDPHEEYSELEARSRVTAAGRPQLRLIWSRRD
jgi:hypothetical protein